MAVTYSRSNSNIAKYIGLSGDDKPIMADLNSTFEESDTNALYKWSGTAWFLSKTPVQVDVDTIVATNISVTNGVANPIPITKIPFEISVEITRNSVTDAYSIGDIINGNSATTLPKLDFNGIGALAGSKVNITSATLLSSNGGASPELEAQIHLFNANTISGQTLTDGTAFAPTYAEIKLKFAAVLANLTSVVGIGTNAYIYNLAEAKCLATLDGASALYAAIIATNAYVPADGEKITLTVKGYLVNILLPS